MTHQTIELSDDLNFFYNEIARIRKNPQQEYPFSISCNDMVIIIRDPIHLDYVLIGINLVLESQNIEVWGRQQFGNNSEINRQ